MSTDYDAWREGEEVTVAAVLAVMAKNSGNVTKALVAVVPKIAAQDWSKDIAHAHDGRLCCTAKRCVCSRSRSCSASAPSRL